MSKRKHYTQAERKAMKLALQTTEARKIVEKEITDGIAVPVINPSDLMLEYLEKIFFDAILHENRNSGSNELQNNSEYEKIGDYKVKNYVERPHEYKK